MLYKASNAYFSVNKSIEKINIEDLLKHGQLVAFHYEKGYSDYEEEASDLLVGLKPGELIYAIKGGFSLEKPADLDMSPTNITTIYTVEEIAKVARYLQEEAIADIALQERIDDADKNGNTAMHLMALDPSKVFNLSGFGAAVTVLPKVTPVSSITDEYHGVDLLVKHGANVNAQNKHGYTPLMFAAKLEQIDVVSKLLSHGADPFMVNSYGKTAIDIAEEANPNNVCVKVIQSVMMSLEAEKMMAQMESLPKP